MLKGELHPYQNWACLHLKIYTFFENNMIILKQIV